MKTSALFVVLVCLLTGCGMQKRLYRNGYYTNWSYSDRIESRSRNDSMRLQALELSIETPRSSFLLSKEQVSDSLVVAVAGDEYCLNNSSETIIRKSPELNEMMQDTSAAKSTYEWVIPVAGIGFTIFSVIAEITFGWYVIAVIALTVGICLIVFGFIRIAKFSKARKINNATLVFWRQCLVWSAIAINVFNSIFAILLSFWLASMLFF